MLMIRVEEWAQEGALSNGALCVAGERASGLFRNMADEEAKVKPATRAFYSSALPAVPILLLGLLCREGVELVRPLILEDKVD
jgi:hypothetical protein